MALTRKAVITGIGIVSPIGVGKAAFWESLCARRSGVTISPLLADAEFPVRIGAHVAAFDAKQYIRPRKSLKVMCREIQMAVSAATLASDDAGLAPESVDPDRLGVLFGSEMFYGELEELIVVYRNCREGDQFLFERWGARMTSDLFPLFMLKYLPNMAACHVAIAHDARGPNNTIALGEASSLLALAEAARVIERDHADVMFVGGAGNRLNLTPMLYRGHSNLSRPHGSPETASRPFDRGRNGLVNGEGACVFVLESESHAARRGARIMARVLGGGQSYGPVDGPAARTSAPVRNSIVRALRDAGVNSCDVGHVNAHGLSTVEDDALEAQAIHDCLGETLVTAPKSYFGSLGAGGGAVETAVSVLSFEHGLIPPTLNYDDPDPQCPVRVIHGEPMPLATPQTALLLNQSGTGQAAAVLIAAP
jgi:3-oxoacyl-[acyl-carrier-protein] synthase II